MADTLLQAYLDSAYKVRLPGGGRAVIRIGRSLPPILSEVAAGRDWGFLTAWNPHSRPTAPQANRAAQRRLLAALRQRSGIEVFPALGVGTDGWREPSLWLLGIAADELAALGRQFGQYGWLQGSAGGPARLRLDEVTP